MTSTTTTATTTMTVPERLVALARVDSMPYDHRRESEHRYNPGLAGGAVRELIEKLRAVGLPPTDLAKCETLAAVTYPKPVTPPGRRVDMSPADFQQRIIDLSLYAAARDAMGRQLSYEVDVIRQELVESMRSEADTYYIDALRPCFEAAMSDFRTAVQLGITVYSEAEDAMDLGHEAVTAWRAMTGPKGMAKALDGIAGIRIRLSLALGFEPVNRHAQQGPLAYGVCFGAGASLDQYTGWKRWLSIAATGNARLVGLHELPVGGGTEPASVEELEEV